MGVFQNFQSVFFAIGVVKMNSGHKFIRVIFFHPAAEVIFVPGTHTPLGWAQVSLYSASKLFEENLPEYVSNLFKKYGMECPAVKSSIN